MNSRSFIESAIERIWRLGHAHANIANTSAISMTVDVPFISAVIRTRIGSDGMTTNVSVITVSTRSTMPPEKPAISPTSTPTTVPIVATIRPIDSEL